MKILDVISQFLKNVRMLNNLFRTLLFFFLIVYVDAEAQDTDVKYNIAYNVLLEDTSDNYEVFSMRMDGTNKRNITNLKGVEWTYYAYKNRLFYISDKDTCHRCYFLYEMDIDGNHKRKVSNLRLEDSWMSTRNNGQEIVVSGRIGKSIRYQLFMINTVTGEFKQITHDTAAHYSDPAFSPDGTQLVCAYNKNKRDTLSTTELFLINTDGTNLYQLTKYPQSDPAFKSYHYKAGVARWHPTGKFITYISYQNGRNNIYCVTPDGKKHWRLTNTDTNENWYDWSDDGKWLVYESYDGVKQHKIYLMNMETGEIECLTDNTYRLQQSPVFVRTSK